MSRERWARRVWVALLATSLALALLPFVESDRDIVNSDWPSFYIAGRLATEDPARLYDREAAATRQLSLLGPGGYSLEGQGPILPVVMPPWMALTVAPFTAAGLTLGGRLWVLAEVLALAAGLLLASGWSARRAALAAMAGVPAALMVVNAQVDGLLVLGVGAAWRLERTGRPALGGLALSLALMKPHLALGLAAGLLATARWRMLSGWAAGGGLLLAAAIARQVSWPLDWVRTLLANGGSLGREVSLPGLAFSLVGNGALRPVAAVAAIALALVVTAVAARQARTGAGALAAMLAGGLLAAPHALATDTVVMTPGLAALGRIRAGMLAALSAGSLILALLRLPALVAVLGSGLLLWMMWRLAQAEDGHAPVREQRRGEGSREDTRRRPGGQVEGGLSPGQSAARPPV